MSVTVEAKPLTGAIPGGGKPGATVAVEPLLGAEMQAPARFLEGTGGRFDKLRGVGIGTPRSKWRWLPIPAFLIHHPGAGTILVDTAMHPSVDAEPTANLGRFFGTVSKVRVPDGDLASQLRDRDLDPKAIETVIMTHLHYDHSSGMSEFPNATFVMSDREWEAATTVSRPLLHGYRRAHFDYLFDYRLVDFNGPLIDSYAAFGRTFDLLGDGSVRLAFTPGHTAGHLSVVCRLQSHDFVIAGDAVYTRAQLAGDNVPPIYEDMHQWQRSRRELQRFAQGFPDAVIVPGHDPDAFAALAARYE